MTATPATARTERGYRLLPGEPMGEGIRRIAAGRADSALEAFRKTAAADPAEGIHEGRKDLKKLRSTLRLVRETIGDQIYERENGRYRRAGRMLSGARDAEARWETLEELRSQGSEAFPAAAAAGWIESLQRDRGAAAKAAMGGELQRVTALVAEGREAIADLPLATDSFELVGPGLRRAYRRGRNRLADVGGEPTETNVHEWRKRVKDLWYMMRILTSLWPEAIEPVAEEAHRLSSLLGDHHDLAVLIADAKRRTDGFDGDARAELLELCRRRQAELLGEAVPLGRRLYAEKPRRFAARIEAYWESGAASR